MPLIKSKSKQAFKKNVETEMKSGKDQKQSLAIAYNVKRKSAKKMAQGGEVREELASKSEAEGSPIHAQRIRTGNIIPYSNEAEAKERKTRMPMLNMAHGGSVTEAIMRRKKEAMMPDDEMVDIDENAEEQPNMYDLRNREALDENFDESIDDLHQDMNNLDGSEGKMRGDKESDIKDMIRKIRMKRGI